MNNQTPHTPLESLFLFQSLLTQGLDAEAFSRVSEILRNNALVKSDATFDAARLAPDALQHLFLAELRDQVKGETGQAETTATAGLLGSGSGLALESASASAQAAASTSGSASASASTSAQAAVSAPTSTLASPASRQNETGSSPLPSLLREAHEHIDKVPALLDRLYARYRDTVVKQIREDESRLFSIQREITVLEKNEKERLAKAAATQNTSNSTALAPRDGRSGGSLAPNTPGQMNAPSQIPLSTVPLPPVTAQQSGGGGIKRAPPTTTTPVYPPKSLPKPAAQSQSAVAPPSVLPPATTQMRLAPSPQRENVASPGLQAPVGMAQPSPRAAVQTPSQSPRQTLAARPEGIAIASRPKDATPVPVPVSVPASPRGANSAAGGGSSKWERPDQPSTAQTPSIPGQTQQAPATAPNASPATAAKSGGPRPGPPQWSPQPAGQTPTAIATPIRTVPGKPVLAAPLKAGSVQSIPLRSTGTPGLQSQQPRPISTAPVAPPVRSIQPQQALQPQQQQQQPPQQQQQQQQKHQHQQQQPPSNHPQSQQPLHTLQPSRPIAAAQQILQKNIAESNPPSQKWTPGHTAQTPRPEPSLVASPAPLSTQRDKSHASPSHTQAPKSAIPEHIIRQAAAAAAAAAANAANASTPMAKRFSPAIAAPSTPGATTPIALTRGFGTKWASHSTPSTPRPIPAEPESPAYEPVSPPPRSASILADASRAAAKRDARGLLARTDSVLTKARGRPARSAHRGRGASTTPSVSATTRRSMSIASQADELSMDHHNLPFHPPPTTTKIKHEVLTPRHMEETGDTTADESATGRITMITSASVASRLAKRKRQDSPPPVPSGPPTHVLWTRGFTKVSSSALDQISSHRDANMFATGVRERDAPNYRQIVLQPQDITSIRSAIKQGNKAALQAASALPGGDPGTASVWLPMSEDLVPPRAIINSAQLERELVHMFCNAIMYNPDPDRGPGPSFLKRSQDEGEEEEIVGYHLDEFGVVKNTRSMFVEVEKLLGDLRSAEKERGVALPPASLVSLSSASSFAGAGAGAGGARRASEATPGDDTAEDEDELAGDGNTSTASVVKRRRVATRN
ncbi:hypothetical protein E4U60_004760 [Claviceps pazoutovae]|uniref:Bromo domain-containing protein n=1 Tax=Claviceps pazoutovae TaxID=1649127 RepID=A0A9P7SJY3_9HYPO|nr:hypothetical protein E4U60_004760 [Claviceps pazoutovae]